VIEKIGAERDGTLTVGIVKVDEQPRPEETAASSISSAGSRPRWPLPTRRPEL
jgi:hypothetical protein